MARTSYARALALIELATSHAQKGSADSARTVLRAAYFEGDLGNPSRLAGRLQHDAVVALVDALERKPNDAIPKLRQVLSQVGRLPAADRSIVLKRCDKAMLELPHLKTILGLLADAKRQYPQRQYLEAFGALKAARVEANKHRDLTPGSVVQDIASVADAAMAHLLENNHHRTVMEILRELRSKGYIA